MMCEELLLQADIVTMSVIKKKSTTAQFSPPSPK